LFIGAVEQAHKKRAAPIKKASIRRVLDLRSCIIGMPPPWEPATEAAGAIRTHTQAA
jgi:hypothetical protein